LHKPILGDSKISIAGLANQSRKKSQTKGSKKTYIMIEKKQTKVIRVVDRYKQTHVTVLVRVHRYWEK